MKKVMLTLAMVIGLTSPSFAWYDGNGYYHCTYLDPLTSFFDSIFGQPCPPPVAVVQAPPVVVEKQVPVYVDRPVPVPVPQPVPVVPVGPCPTYGYWCW